MAIPCSKQPCVYGGEHFPDAAGVSLHFDLEGQRWEFRLKAELKYVEERSGCWHERHPVPQGWNGPLLVSPSFFPIPILKCHLHAVMFIGLSETCFSQ